jgi:hypothetical protein
MGCPKQGDQIVQFFNYWANVFFGQFFLKIKKVAKNFGLFSSTEKVI